MLHNTLVLNYLPFSVLQQQWVVTHLKWFDGSDSAEYRDEVARCNIAPLDVAGARVTQH